MKKKLQLVSVLFLLLTSVSVLSAEVTFTVGNLKYALISYTDVGITGYVTNPTGSLTIPSTVTNAGTTYIVSGIYTPFQYCTGLTTVSIPSSLLLLVMVLFWDVQG